MRDKRRGAALARRRPMRRSVCVLDYTSPSSRSTSTRCASSPHVTGSSFLGGIAWHGRSRCRTGTTCRASVRRTGSRSGFPFSNHRKAWSCWFTRPIVGPTQRRRLTRHGREADTGESVGVSAARGGRRTRGARRSVRARSRARRPAPRARRSRRRPYRRLRRGPRKRNAPGQEGAPGAGEAGAARTVGRVALYCSSARRGGPTTSIP